jgi:hypothetical protein
MHHQSPPLPSESPREEATAFVRTAVRKGPLRRLKFDVETRDKQKISRYFLPIEGART